MLTSKSKTLAASLVLCAVAACCLAASGGDVTPPVPTVAQEQPKKDEKEQDKQKDEKKEEKKKEEDKDAIARLDALKQRVKLLEVEAKKLHAEMKKELEQQVKKADEDMARTREMLKGAKGDRATFVKANEAMRKASDARSRAQMELGKIQGGLHIRGDSERPPLPKLFRDKEIGLSTEPPAAPLAAQLGLAADQGRVVARVEEGSIAARAGLATHDVLVKMDKKPVPSSSNAFRKALDDAGPGAVVEFTVTRQGKPQTINLTMPGKAEAKKEEPKKDK